MDKYLSFVVFGVAGKYRDRAIDNARAISEINLNGYLPPSFDHLSQTERFTPRLRVLLARMKAIVTNRPVFSI